jgi:transketolase
MQTMRNVFLENLYNKMKSNKNIFFLSADFGSPVLDKIRNDFKERFINVGIAEQNLINVATGLALEGFDVYAYAIAPFITMRCFEQIRINLAIMSEIKNINVNLIGVGAGVSYDMSGPTHHCLEDLSIINTLPNIEIFSPSDYMLVKKYVNRSLDNKYPKYLRFDAKPVKLIQNDITDFENGFRILKNGKNIAIISTGFMTQKITENIDKIDATVIDLYFINRFNRKKLEKILENIEVILILEEAFIGGLLTQFNYLDKKIINLGFDKKYSFDIGDREHIHKKSGLDINNILKIIKRL